MTRRSIIQALWVIGLLWAACLAGSGCQSFNPPQTTTFEIPGAGPDLTSVQKTTGPTGSSPYITVGYSAPPLPAAELATPVPGPAANVPLPMPRELTLVTQPRYTIAPPDILEIDAVRLVPKPPYKIQPLDSILLQITEVLKEEPVVGLFAVGSDGSIDFGPTYGSVQLDGLTIEEAQKAIKEQFVKAGFKKAEVRVSQGQSRAQQLIRGQHLVRPDGTVALGIYGSVYVAGFTVDEAKAALEAQLSQYLVKPELSVDVLAYNSKVFYIITSGAGSGETVYRLPSTGSETVLDAVGAIGGLPAVASLHHIWIARPSPAGSKCSQVLKVDWKAITQSGSTDTNYQILPGDRLYVDANGLIKADTFMGQFFAPLTRVLGFTLLGSSVAHTVPEHIQYRTSGGGTGTTP
jgi:polysaccharide biosynthesis/export protein